MLLVLCPFYQGRFVNVLIVLDLGKLMRSLLTLIDQSYLHLVVLVSVLSGEHQYVMQGPSPLSSPVCLPTCLNLTPSPQSSSLCLYMEAFIYQHS